MDKLGLCMGTCSVQIVIGEVYINDRNFLLHIT